MCGAPSCYGVEMRKARIEHKCCECHGIIKRGETYNYHHGVWDGEGASFKVCVDCETLRVDCDHGREYEERTPYGGLSETVMAVEVQTLLASLIEIKTRRGAEIPEWMQRKASR